MIRETVLSIFFVGLVVSNVAGKPTPTVPKTVDEAVALLNRGASMGRAAINLSLTLELIQTNVNSEWTADEKTCVRNGINKLRSSTSENIDLVLNALIDVVKGGSDADISSEWRIIADQLFGDDSIIDNIKETVEDEINNIKEDCVD